jgi:hypothetical protein
MESQNLSVKGSYTHNTLNIEIIFENMEILLYLNKLTLIIENINKLYMI